MSFVNRFPFAPVLESALISRLKQAGVDYDADVKPLFGNPVVLAEPSGSLSSGRRFVGVWVTKSESGLKSLIQKTSSGLHQVGTRDGATLYQSSSTYAAVDGATLVLGSSRDEVVNALDRHAHGGHGDALTPGEYSRDTAGLPAGAELQAFGDLRQVLASKARSGSAVRVPWVSAIRGYGIAVSASSSGVAVHYHIDTSGSSLTPAQLPLPASSAGPSLPTGFPIAAGLRGPQHLVAFIQSAEQLASPATYARFLRRQASLRAKTGVDLNDLLSQLAGDVVIGSDAHSVLVRAEVIDAKTTARVLAGLAKDPQDAFQTGSVTRAGNTYVFKRPDGDTVVQLIGKRILVGTKTTAAQLQAFAHAATVPAANAQGPLAFSVQLAELIGLALKRSHTSIPPSVTGMLGDITGWAANTPAGLNGIAELTLK